MGIPLEASEEHSIMNINKHINIQGSKQQKTRNIAAIEQDDINRSNNKDRPTIRNIKVRMK